MRGKLQVLSDRSLVNAMSLQLEYARMVHEALFRPVLLYVSKTMVWREKSLARIRAVQMDFLGGLLDIMKIKLIYAKCMDNCNEGSG